MIGISLFLQAWILDMAFMRVFQEMAFPKRIYMGMIVFNDELIFLGALVLDLILEIFRFQQLDIWG